MMIIEDKQVNLIAIWGNKELTLEDVSSIMFDGRDAVVKLRDRCLNQHVRCFDSIVLTVVDRKEPLKEDVRSNYYFLTEDKNEI